MTKPKREIATQTKPLYIPESIYLGDLRENVIHKMIISEAMTFDKVQVILDCHKDFEDIANLAINIDTKGQVITHNVKIRLGKNSFDESISLKKDDVVWLTFNYDKVNENIKKSDFQLTLAFNRRVKR